MTPSKVEGFAPAVTAKVTASFNTTTPILLGLISPGFEGRSFLTRLLARTAASMS